jgi:hypothetical protein
VTQAVEDTVKVPLPETEQFPETEPILTCTVGNVLATAETSSLLGVVNVALAPPVAESTLQLTVGSDLPFMLTLICLVDPVRTWNGYLGTFAVMVTCANDLDGSRNSKHAELIAIVMMKPWTLLPGESLQ